MTASTERPALPSDVMERGGTVHTPDGLVDVAHLCATMEADGFTVLECIRFGRGPLERYRTRARWPAVYVLGGRPGRA